MRYLFFTISQDQVEAIDPERAQRRKTRSQTYKVIVNSFFFLFIYHRKRKEQLGVEADPIYVKYPYASLKQSEKNVVTIHKSDLQCLNEGEFLNDNIIDFYIRYFAKFDVSDVTQRLGI